MTSTLKPARLGWLAGAVGVAVLGFSVFNFNGSSVAQPVSVTPRTVAVGQGSFADVIESVSPAVVNIAVSKVETAAPTFFQYSQPGDGRQYPFDEFFERFFGPNGPQGGQGMPQRRSEGQGSGFLIDASGYIVTNNHVAGDAEKITVTFQDGRELDAKLVGRDPKTDLALIKVEATGLPFVAFGDSDRARVGDWVVAIGNPFGLGGTATAGIISARGRDIGSGSYDDFLQLDAPINFGNSGGPVFNTAGEVVGVNTAIFSPNGGNIGIGFAIPANQAKAIVADLKENGSVERGWLGVQIQNLDYDIAQSLGLSSEHGALVSEVVPDGPAAKGGIEPGDVITRFNGQEIESTRTLTRVVADAPPSRPATVTVWRDGRSRDLTVQLGEAEQTEAVAAVSPGGNQPAGAALGLALRPLTDQDRAQLDLPSDVQGALVVNVAPGSDAAEKGLRPGDVITSVNQQGVDSVGEAVTALNAAKANGGRALLRVRRGEFQRFVALSFS